MSRVRIRGEWRFIYGAMVLGVLGLFLFSIKPVLTPIVLFLLLVGLLVPYAGTRTHLLALLGASLLVLLWLLKTTGFLLAQFLLAFAIAYILDPAVDLFEKRGVPRAVAIFVLLLPGAALAALGMVFGVPALAEQVASLVSRAPEALARGGEWVSGLHGKILRLDLPIADETTIRAVLQGLGTDRITAWLSARPEEIMRGSWGALLGVGKGLGTVLSVLGYVFLTPILGYYLLRDYDRLTETMKDLIPLDRRESWLAFMAEYDRLLARYLRGQLLAAVLVGVLTGVGLWIAGFPYAGLVGAVAAIFNVVPFLGLIVSLIPAILIALLSGNIVVSLIKVAAVFGLVQLLDSTVLGPRIVGGSVGLHPVWVILALAVGGFFLGLVGLLLAVPVAVLLRLILRNLLERYRNSDLYQPTPERSLERVG